MHEFWYGYIELKHQDKENLCHMDSDSFIVNIKTAYVHKNIASDVEKRFYPSNYEIGRSLWIGTNKKVVGLMKDKLVGKIMTEVAEFNQKNLVLLNKWWQWW